MGLPELGLESLPQAGGEMNPTIAINTRRAVIRSKCPVPAVAACGVGVAYLCVRAGPFKLRDTPVNTGAFVGEANGSVFNEPHAQGRDVHVQSLLSHTSFRPN